MSKSTATDVYNHYNALSQERALTEPESRALERAIRELDRVGTVKYGPWTEYEDARLRLLKRQGQSFEQIAATLHRTKNSCANRYTRIAILELHQERQRKMAATVRKNELIRKGKVAANPFYADSLDRTARKLANGQG